MGLRFLVVGLLVAGAIAGCCSGVAIAGTYDVLSCGAAPAGGADDAWQAVGSGSGIISTKRCPPEQRVRFSGLFLRDDGQIHTTAVGEGGGWRIQAPTGAQITSVTYLPRISKFDEEWTASIETSEGKVLDTCHLVVGEGGSCLLGNSTYFNEISEVRRSHSNLETTALVLGLRCESKSGTSCLKGTIQPYAEAGIYSSTVTIEDPTPPRLEAINGTLVDPVRSLHQGSESVEVRASDITGIKAARVYVDGHLAQEQRGTCDYSRVVPCRNDSLQVNFDTATLTDGLHQIEVAAVDGAGNETRSASQQIKVENRPPVEVVPPPIPVKPIDPPVPVPGRPIVPPFTKPLPTTNPPVQTPPVKPSQAQKQQPKLRIASVRKKGPQVTVTGHIAASAHGKVIVSYRIGGRTIKRTVQVKGGAWKAVVRIPRGAKGKATVRAVYGGDRKFKSAKASRKT